MIITNQPTNIVKKPISDVTETQLAPVVRFEKGYEVTVGEVRSVVAICLKNLLTNEAHIWPLWKQYGNGFCQLYLRIANYVLTEKRVKSPKEVQKTWLLLGAIPIVIRDDMDIAVQASCKYDFCVNPQHPQQLGICIAGKVGITTQESFQNLLSIVSHEMAHLFVEYCNSLIAFDYAKSKKLEVDSIGYGLMLVIGDNIIKVFDPPLMHAYKAMMYWSKNQPQGIETTDYPKDLADSIFTTMVALTAHKEILAHIAGQHEIDVRDVADPKKQFRTTLFVSTYQFVYKLLQGFGIKRYNDSDIYTKITNVFVIILKSINPKQDPNNPITTIHPVDNLSIVINQLDNLIKKEMAVQKELSKL